MNGYQKVNKICNDILNLTDEDLECVKEMAKQQQEYLHPLKHNRQRRINTAGMHNEKILSSIKAIQQELKNYTNDR